MNHFIQALYLLKQDVRLECEKNQHNSKFTLSKQVKKNYRHSNLEVARIQSVQHLQQTKQSQKIQTSTNRLTLLNSIKDCQFQLLTHNNESLAVIIFNQHIPEIAQFTLFSQIRINDE